MFLSRSDSAFCFKLSCSVVSWLLDTIVSFSVIYAGSLHWNVRSWRLSLIWSPRLKHLFFNLSCEGS